MRLHRWSSCLLRELPVEPVALAVANRHLVHSLGPPWWGATTPPDSFDDCARPIGSKDHESVGKGCLLDVEEFVHGALQNQAHANTDRLGHTAGAEFD